MRFRLFFRRTGLASAMWLTGTMGAFAQFAGGDGSSGNPYQIATPAQLVSLATYVYNGDINYYVKCYILTADLDLSAYGANYNSGKGWFPIGSSGYEFLGVFDGDKHKITGLYINDASLNYAGLFGYVYGGTIKNVAVVNANIAARGWSGCVVGEIYNSNITNCYSTGKISGTYNCIGGVVGSMYGNSNMSNCYSTCTVSNTGDFTGGITATVENGSTLKNCYSTGAVSGKGAVGGIAGVWQTADSVKNCAALNPSVKATGTPVGRIAYNNGGTLSNNIAFDGIKNNAGNTLWYNKGPQTSDGVDTSAADINADGSLGGRFTSANGWTIQNGKLPGLFGETVEMPLHLQTAAGTNTDPFLIASAQQLEQLAQWTNAADTNYNNKHYKVIADIDLSDYGASYNGGKGWIPIGFDYLHSFKGVFDGNQHKITGLYINDASRNVCGLFGMIYGTVSVPSIIKNVAVVNVSIKGYEDIGAIVGGFSNGSVINCYSTGIVNGQDYVGGLVGDVGYEGYVSNCYSTCTVTGTYGNSGGVVGVVSEGYVANCYSTGAVNGVSWQLNGGVVGWLVDYGVVTDCAALNPSVKSTGTYFGRVAFNDGATLSNNIAFDGMKNAAGNTTWNNKGEADNDGEDISAADINADGSLGGRFTSANGWTVRNGKLPGLFGETVEMPLHLQTATGTDTDPFLIASAQQLEQLAQWTNAGDTNYNNKHYKVIADIDLSDYGKCYNGGKGWIPIGDDFNNHRFKGVFDGNQHTITGLYINSAADEIGLFGTVYGGTIKNLAVVNADVRGSSLNVGSIVGFIYESSVINTCYSTGIVSGSYRQIGGIVGGVRDVNTVVTNCYSTVSVSGDDAVGGIAGATWGGGTISNCYSIGTVSGNTNVGGISGSSSSSAANFLNCAALNPSVKGTGSNVGRVGNSGGTLSNNIAWDGMLTISDDTIWNNKGAANLDGEDVTKIFVNMDDTLGGRFTSSGGWTTKKYKLPGLFGKTVDMPDHLKIPIPPAILTNSLPDGVLNAPYSETLVAEGDTVITWAMESGNLPDGLTLYSNGAISGTPSKEDNFTFTVRASNAIGSDTKTLSILVTEVGIRNAETGRTASLRIYPNPTGGKFTILDLRLDDLKSNDLEFEIYDIVGQVVLQSKIVNLQSKIEIDISHLSAGLYFLKIDGKTFKVVKE